MASSTAYNIAFPTFSAEREVKQLIRNVLSNKRVKGKKCVPTLYWMVDVEHKVISFCTSIAVILGQ